MSSRSGYWHAHSGDHCVVPGGFLDAANGRAQHGQGGPMSVRASISRSVPHLAPEIRDARWSHQRQASHLGEPRCALTRHHDCQHFIRIWPGYFGAAAGIFFA
jgi:hypothetical protein